MKGENPGVNPVESTYCIGVDVDVVVGGAVEVDVVVGAAVEVGVAVRVGVQGSGCVGTGTISVRELFCSLLSPTAPFESTITVTELPV